MREIKFRGIPKHGAGFVYGFLDIYKSERGEVYEIINHDCGVSRFEVIPESIGQFIGLDDKHKKEIYEGDIVRAFDVVEKNSFTAVIKFRKGSFVAYETDRIIHYRLTDYDMEVSSNVWGVNEVEE